MGRRENTLRKSVILALAELDAVAVENPALPGTPDVNYVEGWIELKSWNYWPRKPETPLKIDHWTPQQRVFHRRRRRAGGRCYMLLELVESHDYVLLDGDTAARILGTATRAELEAEALGLWRSKAEMKAGLLAYLSRENLCPPSPPPIPNPQ